jgi:hypothetical protein
MMSSSSPARLMRTSTGCSTPSTSSLR